MRDEKSQLKKILAAAVFLFSIFYFLFFASGARAGLGSLKFAGAAPGERGFGGAIAGVRQCTCSGGWLLTITAPAPGKFLYKPGSAKIFPFGNLLKTGPFVLGSAKAPGSGDKCEYGSCVDPLAEKPDGVIKQIGTSR